MTDPQWADPPWDCPDCHDIGYLTLYDDTDQATTNVCPACLPAWPVRVWRRVGNRVFARRLRRLRKEWNTYLDAGDGCP